MKCLLLLLTLATLAAASRDAVDVDDLEDLVTSSADRQALKVLDEDNYMIRSEKQQRLNDILARQPATIQQQYNQKMQARQSHDASEQQWRLQQMQQQGYGDLYAQMDAIDNDMSISEADAKQQKRLLRQQMFFAQPTATLKNMDFDMYDD